MITLLIHLLVVLLVAGLIWWAATKILAVVTLPEPIKTVIYVILVVILCLFLIYAILPFAGSWETLR